MKPFARNREPIVDEPPPWRPGRTRDEEIDELVAYLGSAYLPSTLARPIDWDRFHARMRARLGRLTHRR